MLDDERTALKKRKKDLLKEAESAGAGRGNELSFELQQIDKRLEELGEILETRTAPTRTRSPRGWKARSASRRALPATPGAP